MAKFKDVLKERNFLLLWLGQIVSQLGDRLDHMALIALVYTRAPGSTIQMAKLLAFTIIPLVVLGPIAGAYVDRWDRRKTMITCDILRGILVLCIPLFLIHSKAIMPVYIIVFSVFALGCLFIPARLSIIPSLVTGDKLLLANSLSSTTSVVAAFIGFAVGGIIVEFIGPRGAFYIDAATYLMSALLVTFIVSRKKILPDKAVLKKSILRDIKEGMVYLKEHHHARYVADVLVLLMAAAGSIYAVGIVFIQERFGSITKDLSILGVFLGTGFFISAMSYGRFGHKIEKSRAISAGLFASGILVCAFTIVVKVYANYALIASTIFLIGFAVAPVVISSNTLIHEITRDELRGRVFTSLGALMSASLLVFMFLSSYIAEANKKMWVLIGAGIIMAAFGAWSYFFPSLNLRRQSL
ncbi:MAG: MFS transporter [Candidatus Omnitrophota bacterium]